MNTFRSILALSLVLGLSSIACVDEVDDQEQQEEEEMGSTESELVKKKTPEKKPAKPVAKPEAKKKK